MKDHSRQLEFMEIDLTEEPEASAVPVPERSTIPHRQFHSSQTGGSILSSEKRFVEEARQLEEAEGEPAPFVPFMSYWPTYGVMNESQREWYLYWRSEVRQRRFPDTDLSYVFVHTYELINGVGWRDPQAGFDQLKQLWIHYRVRNPQLDMYMQEWLVDYTLVHQLDMPLSEILDISSGYLPAEIQDMEMQRILQNRISDVSLNLLRRYYDYDITLSKFYRDGGQEVLEEFIPKVMVLVDSYLLRTRQEGIANQFIQGKPRTTERVLFRKAVYDDTLYGKTVPLSYVPVGENSDFVQLVTRIFRCTENKCRELLGFRGRLRGKTLEPELAGLIERYLDKVYAAKQAEAAEKPMIRIDPEKLTSLQQESEYVRQALTIEEDVDQAKEAAPFEHQALPEPAKVIATSATSVRLQWEEESAGDLDEDWLHLADQLAPQHVLAIYALLGEKPDTELNRVAEQYGTMPALLLDEINDLAMETIGDLLIESDRIVSEYMNVFEHVKR
ncbi:TerB N-terminal domain-containing protein [Paenibacillus sp. ACRRY]|uniref:TerB N-terminal domain-containing protein n=1 Tax=Paenibacillus sp. ACRRY TaxID=2918208 RepID=UPI001EF4D5ED|nr:TerB N-terminal domain-containing protein [Paenibacillus sp. ACRRY]MCG7382224.1 TerB N-terminal domain-containing protein [Paenibacillus sp. ACRRY]